MNDANELSKPNFNLVNKVSFLNFSINNFIFRTLTTLLQCICIAVDAVHRRPCLSVVDPYTRATQNKVLSEPGVADKSSDVCCCYLQTGTVHYAFLLRGNTSPHIEVRLVLPL